MQCVKCGANFHVVIDNPDQKVRCEVCNKNNALSFGTRQRIGERERLKNEFYIPTYQDIQQRKA